MRTLVAILALVVAAFSTAAEAQAPPQPAPDAAVSSLQALGAELNKAQADLQQVSGGLRSPDLDDQTLQTKLAAIPSIQAELASVIDQLTPRLQGAEARLAELGPPPGPGQPPESPAIAQNRRSLDRFHQAVDGEIKQAKLLQVEAGQLSTRLAQRRRELFSERLWAHSRSVFDPILWGDFAEALPRDLGRVGVAVDDETMQLRAAANGGPGVVGAWIAALALAVVLLGPARMVLNRVGFRRADRGPPDRLRGSVVALWLVAVAALTPLLAGLAVEAAFSATGALTPVAEQALLLIIRVVVYAALFEGFGRALLSPGRPKWRLAPLPDPTVARLMAYPALIAAAAGLSRLVAGLNTLVGVSLPSELASDCVTLVLRLLAIGGGLATLSRARSEQLAEAVAETTPRQASSRLPWVLAALAAWLALGATIVAMAAGYLALANFLMGEMIWIALVLAALFLLLRLVDELFPALFAPGQPVGRFIQMAIGVSNAALEQFAVLLSGLFRLAILFAGWTAILLPFGADAGDVFGRVTSSALVIHLGQVSISPGAVFGAVVVFLLGLAATRAVRGWLERSYLPKTTMDVGVRTSIAAGLTYLGALIAALLAFAYLGLSLDRIALFASALSVGIGFGLQSVIGNFVSGLILLAERPVKVGDWIAIGGLEGDVKRVNVRATEIEMFDHSKLIVPNSDLISKTVRNVTHGGAVGRVSIVLKVDDGADPAKVRDLIAARLTAHKEVLKQPAAGVYLTNVADGALEFTAYAYVGSARDTTRVKSELLFEIIPDLKAAGIALASSSTIVNVAPAEPSPVAPQPPPSSAAEPDKSAETKTASAGEPASPRPRRRRGGATTG